MRFRSESFLLSLVGGGGCQRCSFTVLRIFHSFWDGLYTRFTFQRLKGAQTINLWLKKTQSFNFRLRNALSSCCIALGEL